ncbi:MAG: hypothetical protein L0Y56_11995, partial [Nitrospira sp.]|nr:hypothetical protein [Nitrospira sp.]
LISASVVSLSMVLYFLSLFSDLQALKASRARQWGWKLLSILGLFGSTLAYEVVMPLFLLNPLLVWYHGQQLYGSASDKPSNRVSLSALYMNTLLLLLPIVVFKKLVTVRLGNQTGLVEHFITIARKAISFHYDEYSYGLNFKQAVLVHYGDYGLGLPRIVYQILDGYPDEAVFAMGGVLGLFIFGYLYRVAKRSEIELFSQAKMFRFITSWGVIVFGLGYAIFLTNSNVHFTATGVSNRTAMAAAVGVALSLVGGLGWIGTLLPSDRLRRYFFCVLVTLLCLIGFLINNTLASFWIAAYRQQQEVLADIRQKFPTLPAWSTLLLDGVCPYIGPAVVFESNQDLSGALHRFYQDRTLRGNVVTPNLKIREDGLSSSRYGMQFDYFYENLFVYHFGRKTVHPLPDARA